MSAEPRRIDQLIESIADGGSVDWAALEASAADERERRLIGHLRLVAGVADVHRSTPTEELANSGTDWMQPGQAIPRWGRLLLVEKIGEGTFGEVYRSRDPWLDREVALKLLKPGTAGNVPTSRILNEARTLARVRHPNVVTVHGADLHDGRVGLWMEFIRGRTLSTMVAAQGPLSAGEAAIIGQELCRALGAVHAVGLVHGDIKAQNVMRESGGRFVLMDFGAGQFVDGHRSAAMRAAGTPLYLAPEVLRGGHATIQSDIYALGVLLYWLVTGSYPVGAYPVKATSIDDLKAAHARGERRRLRDARPDLPDAFVAAVERAVDPDPQRRFPTAGEMLPAVARVTAGGISARIAAIRPELTQRTGRVRPRQALVTAALVVALVGAFAYWRATRSDSGVAYAGVQHVALMPLRGDADQQYFADGMTESLMQELATLRSIRVLSRTSVDLARQKESTLPAIAKVLKADAILEGSVTTSGDRVRVNVRLIHAGSDTPVWIRTFEEPLQQVFALQRTVARSVVEELEIGFAPLRQAGKPRAVDSSAHDAYLRGRYLLRAGTPEDLRRAVSYFESAISKNPQFAEAHAAMAHAYLGLAGGLTAVPREEGYRRARESVQEALRLDPELPDAHAVLGEIVFHRDWDWTTTEREYQRALAINPSLEFARVWYANFLAARQRTEQALEQLSEARRLDPLSPVPVAVTGAVLRYARRYEEALASYEQALAMQPTYLPARIGLARTLKAMGRFDEAISLYRDVGRTLHVEGFLLSEIAQAQAAAGRRSEALRTLAELRRASAAGSIVTPDAYAYVYAHLGNRQAAFRWLDQAFETKAPEILWIAVDARIDPLRNDPRFGGYLAQLGLAH